MAGPAALSRTTHLGIGAHQDDLEFMAFHGILACYDRADRWFGGVTITDGRGSSRAGKFKDWTDDQIAAERIREQEAAAAIGQYSFIAQLGYGSAAVRDAKQTAVREDLLRLLQATRPEVVYLHNLADKHDTHVGCALRCIEALRLLPKPDRPKTVYGCEVWRDLDWLVDAEKTAMFEDLAEEFGVERAGAAGGVIRAKAFAEPFGGRSGEEHFGGAAGPEQEFDGAFDVMVGRGLLFACRQHRGREERGRTVIAPQGDRQFRGATRGRAAIQVGAGPEGRRHQAGVDG